MRHTTYSGRIVYWGDTIGERGREWFLVTKHHNGDRTIRATCEIDDSQVLRDVVYTVDSRFRPLDAFVRLTVGDEFMGSGWFSFGDDFAECESITTDAGRVSQVVRLSGPPHSFGPHPVACDAWHLALFDLGAADRVQQFDEVLLSSPLPNGASGPMLGTTSLAIEYAGDEEVQVAAGTFPTRHFRFLFENGWPPEEIWCTADEDLVMVRIRWDLLETSYELVELER